MSCICNLGVMGSRSDALDSGAGGEGSGSGGMEFLGSQLLDGLGWVLQKEGEGC